MVRAFTLSVLYSYKLYLQTNQQQIKCIFFFRKIAFCTEHIKRFFLVMIPQPTQKNNYLCSISTVLCDTSDLQLISGMGEAVLGYMQVLSCFI